jgi:hypothetical protein
MSARVHSSALMREILLREAQQRAERLSDREQQRLSELARAVHRRVAAARRLPDPDYTAMALLLYREALVLASGAALLYGKQISAETEPTTEHALELLDGEPAAKSNSRTELGLVRELLMSASLLGPDTLELQRAVQTRKSLERAVRTVRTRYEARSPRELRLARLARVLLLVATLGALVWGAQHLFGPRNIARGKPVQMSSQRPGIAWGGRILSPAGAVDGRAHGMYDILTALEPNPWLVIDLKRERVISSIIVRNRGDCCWGERDLPMVIELSSDGKQFSEVGRRTSPFKDARPWKHDVGGARARYVRVRVASNEPRELVLSEVEVFGR